MALTRSIVEEHAEEYREAEPLHAVEDQHVDMLPRMFAAGNFGRRDVKWVVQWYYRRFLGAVPDDERRAREAAFDGNDFETVLSVIEDVTDAADPARQLDRLTDLEGVDVPVGSAFLMFCDPEDRIVVGEREWTALREADELSEPYPDPPTIEDYEAYLDACQAVADRVDCDMWTLYRALWRLSK